MASQQRMHYEYNWTVMATPVLETSKPSMSTMGIQGATCHSLKHAYCHIWMCVIHRVILECFLLPSVKVTAFTISSSITSNMVSYLHAYTKGHLATSNPQQKRNVICSFNIRCIDANEPTTWGVDYIVLGIHLI